MAFVCDLHIPESKKETEVGSQHYARYKTKKRTEFLCIYSNSNKNKRKSDQCGDDIKSNEK